jgi:NADPH:quinone reductase-like Zn-dependent oxidoreductase
MRSMFWSAVALISWVWAGAYAADAAPPAATMKAVSFTQFGNSNVLRYGDLPTPVPAAGEVLVRVRAASVNPADWKVRRGSRSRGPITAPMIPGYDIAGDVVAVGSGVTAFKNGDAVYAMTPLGVGGAYAQFASVPVANVAAKPQRADYIHAAAVPLAALTAWQALFEVAKVVPGQTVVVQGGAGGVGHFAVQFAKARGVKVIATASARNSDYLREIGSDVVIDYQSTQYENVIKDADVVLDTVGGDTLRRSFAVVKKGGYLVSIVDDPDKAELEKRGIRGSRAVVHTDGVQLAEIGRLIDSGKVKPHVSETLDLQAAAAAQDLSEKGRTRGKIVLRVP